MILFAPFRRARPAGGAPSGLLGRDFVLLLVAVLGTFSNYAPLLSVVPLWSADGGSGHGGAGATTGVVMGTTVAAQLFMGRLTRRFGLRKLLAGGALLLGVPTFAYALSSALPWVLAVSAVRGVGFGVVAVAGAALVAELVTPARRGAAVGLYGLAAGLPQVVALPLGVWCAGRYGFAPVFAATAVLSILAAPVVALMSGGVRRSPADRDAGGGYASAGVRPLAGPFTVLITASCAFGAVTSFLPLALAVEDAAPPALFALSAAIIAGRWSAGAWADRAGTGRLLVPGVAAAALGMAGFTWASQAEAGVTALAAAAGGLYGLGFGALQSETLVVMFRRAGHGGHGLASMAWNMAFDAGTGVGALAAGLLSMGVGLGGSFAVAAAAIVAVAPLAWTGTRHEARTHRAAPATPPHPEKTIPRSGDAPGQGCRAG